jgi:hypothetical protein
MSGKADIAALETKFNEAASPDSAPESSGVKEGEHNDDAAQVEEAKPSDVTTSNDEPLKVEEIPEVTKSDAPVDDAEKVVEEDSAGIADAAEELLEESEGNATLMDEDKENDTMDTDEQDTSTSPVDQGTEETPSTKELPYSTRGRSSGIDVGSEKDSGDSRAAREIFDDIGRKETASAASLGASFLESLSEEERRSRTRFLPDVDGMHILRKNEIKDDLVLARSLVSAAGETSLKNKKKKARGDSVGMDLDGEDGASPSEDDRSSDIARSGTSIEFEARDLLLPSNAFVAPAGSSSDDENQPLSALKNGQKNGIQSPFVVESVVAFNPPRPPESIGAKKKHRMLRWERREQDVESDLNNYRKTVQRTRQELHNAEAEYGRLETIDAHMRWHFLSHLNLLNDEFMRLNDEMGSVQQDCINATDLLSSRTRSRGVGKGHLMKDVLAVLKKNTEKDAMETEIPSTTISSKRKVKISKPASGVGGLPCQSFQDWNDDTMVVPNKPASSWLVPGDNVKTPYGEGTILKVYGPTLQKSKSDVSSNKSEEAGEEKDDGETQKKDEKKKQGEEKSDIDESIAMLPPRVSVKLPFGTGVFSIGNVSPIDDLSIFSDAQLAKRWKGLTEAALSVGGSLDIGAMSSMIDRLASGGSDKSIEDRMNVEDGEQEGSQTSNSDDISDEKFVPFGSGLLPTAYGRGVFLDKMPIEEIEKEINSALYDGKGVLGNVSFSLRAEFYRLLQLHAH